MTGADSLLYDVAPWLVLGAAFAILYIRIGRSLSGPVERWWWVGGLIVAALVYVVMAFARSAPPTAVAFEAGGVVAYGALGLLGLRDRRWIAAAWLLHPVWDLLHRPGGFALAAPSYVWMCLSFDLVVGTWLLVNAARPRA